MDKNLVLRLVEVVVIEEDDNIKLKALNNCDKLIVNGYKSVTLNLDENIFCESINSNLIVALQLQSCNLNQLPDVFINLRLKELDISYNAFMEVPNCVINGLRHLEVINFSHNKLTYFEEPRCVKKLRVLRINNNKFLNVPEWILNVNAFNLEELYYSFNEIISFKDSHFLYTPIYALSKLELRNCAVRNVDLKYLKDIKLLNYLDLSNDSTCNVNCFTSPEDFSNLFNVPRWNDQLKVLHLNNLELADLPDEISQLIVLEELHLKNNQLMWLPDSFFLPSLLLLDISLNQMACLPKHLVQMHNLRILRLACNCISNLSEVPPYLEELDLYDNYLDSHLDVNVNSLCKLDFELNYFDTSILDDYDNYIEKKNLLRDGIYSRRDGGKVSVYDVPDNQSDSGSDTDSSNSSREKCVVDDKLEESWSSDCNGDVCNDGCTNSDNEWTGYEVPKRTVPQTDIKRYPSWIFEDVKILE